MTTKATEGCAGGGSSGRRLDWAACTFWRRVLIAHVLLTVLGIMRVASAGQARELHFEVTGGIEIPAAGGVWDYAAVDAEARRLYLADDGVLMLNLATRRARPELVRGDFTHGIVPLRDGIVAVADGLEHHVTLFVGKSGHVLADIPIGGQASAADWQDPDAMVFEPKTQTLVAVNGDAGTLALIDVRRRVIEGTVRIGGKLEFAAAAGNGIVYVNVESHNELAVVDVPTRRVVRRIALEECRKPTGMAYDQEYHLIISVCDNGVAEFLRAGRDQQVARFRIGRGCDAVLLDASRGLVYFPAGDSGTLSVVALRGPRDIELVQTLPTAPGVRLGAVDPVTGVLYLPTVSYDRTAPPLRLPGIGSIPRPASGSFRFLMVGPGRR